MKDVSFLKVLCLSLFLILTSGQALAGVPIAQSTTVWQRAAQNQSTTVFGQLSSHRPKGKRYREDAIIVKFKPGASEAGKQNLHKRHGSTVVKSFDHLRMQSIKVKSGLTVEEALKKYKADPLVEYAEPDYLVKVLSTPDDPLFNALWGFNRINVPAAWNTTTGSSDTVVAVIDTGVDYTHPDLAANVWTNPGINVGYAGDAHGIDTFNHDSDPMDDHFHGTHVAGTIGATGNNGLGVVGINWNVKLLACKFLDASGNGFTSGAVECLEYVRMLKAQGVNLVATNNSWAGDEDSTPLKEAIAAQGDILFIAAAGNDSSNIDAVPSYPAAYTLPNVITVAATDGYDNLASFSNTGRNSVHVAAPGTSIYSTVPGSSYDYLQGTSMAAPHVTGLAALLKSSGNDWKQIKNLILAGGDSVAALSGKTITGRRINAATAVSCTDRPLLALQQLPNTLQAGTAVTLSAISINCSVPVGPVSVTITSPGGGTTSLSLRDDGAAPDEIAGDGIFSTSWTPSTSGSVALSFNSPAGSQTVAYPPLAISALATVASPAVLAGNTASTNTGVPFSEIFSATGGIPPYSWSIVGGSLPLGLSLNSATAEISGTPTATGSYSFTLQVTDSVGLVASSSWAIVLGQGIRQGWPQMLQSKPGSGLLPMISSSPIFADVDGDGKDELIVADYTENTKPATLYLFKENGLAATYQFPDVQPYARIYSTPAVADLFNDGRKEIIVSVGWPSTTPPLYVFDKDLKLLPGFPAGHYDTYNLSPGFCGSPVIADLNNDGIKSILVDCSPNNIYDPNQGKNVLVMIDPQGAMVGGWPKMVSSVIGQSEPMPVVGDLDNDGKKEVVLLGADGILHVYRKDGTEVSQWVAAEGPTHLWNPVMADFDGDGFLEIAVKQNFDDAGNNRHRISVFNRNGVLLPGWPQVFSNELGIIQTGGIIAADVDGDLHAEIITNSGPDWSQWHAFKVNGALVQGWPTTASSGRTNFNAFPVVGDINGDSGQEFLFTTTDWWSPDTWLWGYSGGSTPLATYPKLAGVNSEVRSSPALGDLDGNGRIDVAVKGEDGTLNVWESEATSNGFLLQWPVYAHDLEHTGTLHVQGMQPRAPATDFLGTPLTGQAPLTVSFVDNSSNFPSSWLWDFGDGGTSTLRNPQHTYSAVGTYTVSLTATNAYGSNTKTRTGFVNVVAPLTITTVSPLPQAVVGVAYSQNIAVTGGSAPYTWSIVYASGSLPTGMTLNGTTGLISGTPTTVGTKGFTIQVTDAQGLTATKAFVLSVNLTASLIINTSTLPHGTVGTSYNQLLSASGGTSPYSWSQYLNVPTVNGSLPYGLALNAATGSISGTPTTTGSYMFYARVTDSAGKLYTRRLAIVIDDALCSSPPLQTVGAATSQYYDFPTAYAQLADNDTVMLRALTLSGNMTFATNVRVRLKGGYDCGYGSNDGSTVVVSGKLTVKDGTVTVDKLRFR